MFSAAVNSYETSPIFADRHPARVTSFIIYKFLPIQWGDQCRVFQAALIMGLPDHCSSVSEPDASLKLALYQYFLYFSANYLNLFLIQLSIYRFDGSSGITRIGMSSDAKSAARKRMEISEKPKGTVVYLMTKDNFRKSQCGRNYLLFTFGLLG